MRTRGASIGAVQTSQGRLSADTSSGRTTRVVCPVLVSREVARTRPEQAKVEVEVVEVAVIVEDASTAVRRDTGRAVSLMLSEQSSRYSDILHD